MSKKAILGAIGGIMVLGVTIWAVLAFLVFRPSENSDQIALKNSQITNETGGTKMSGKVLVAYYSAQGHTKAVAEQIAQNLGAELFEIEPREVYAEEDLDWTASDSRVSREHADESLREVALVQATPENWGEYETILVGYPIWWGIAAWPVDGFVRTNDFSGKTVIPFATAASSGLGQSGELLAEMANGGDWQAGRRFSSNASAAEIKEWTDSLWED